MTRTIVLTGGGTAGHVTPNLALLEPLKQAGFAPVYVGSPDGIERELASQAGLPYHAVQVGKLRRYMSLRNLTDPARLVAGVGQAALLMRKLAPAVVFSKGGFVGVPVCLGARVNGIPVVVHESDMTPGLANRICFPFAARICTAHEETQALIDRGDAVVHTGTPLRPELLAGDREQGQSLFRLDPEKRTLLVFGGSLGAEAINEALRKALPLLPQDMQVLHVCGKGNRVDSLDGQPRYQQHEYLNERFAHALAAADLVISRAGANSLVELAALGKPALVIPLPGAASRGDQIDNARRHEEKGYGVVLDQAHMSPERLVRELDKLQDGAAALQRNMQRDVLPDAAAAIVNILSAVAR